jgi:ornithine cyclodeaminase/alanine dehydrogenase
MTAHHGILHLRESELGALGITPEEIADAIEAAVLAQGEGRLWTVPKSALMPGDGRYMMTTLSVADVPQLTVIKTAMVSPRNPDRGLEGTQAALFLLDSETGLLRCVMGGNWVTAVRTAGLSAVMARRLADPGSSVLALVGCGAQARSHLQAFAALFPLAEVRAFGRGRANVDRLCALAGDLGLAARVCGTAREALEGADLVVSSVTLNPETAPFLDARWLKPGAFAAITDQAIPWLPDTMDAFGAAYVDDRAQEAASARPMIDPGKVSGDLGEVVRGDVPAAFDPARRSAFLFRGIAIGDFAVAALAYEAAQAQGLGTVWPG